MQLYDPTTAPAVQNNRRAPAPVSLQGMRLGLLSNGKENADHLLRMTAAHFEKEHGCIAQQMRYKSNASAPASDDMMQQLIEDSDLLLTANGD